MTTAGVNFAPRSLPAAQSSGSSLPRPPYPEDPLDRRSPGVTFSTPPIADRPSPPLPDTPPADGPERVPVHRTTSGGTGDRRGLANQASSPCLGRSQSITASSGMASSPPSNNKDNNMFGRVVRKLSKRVKPPSQRFAAGGEAEANAPARGRVDSHGRSADLDARRRARSREQMRMEESGQVRGRRPSLEWGPPPLQASDWVPASETRPAPPAEPLSSTNKYALASRSFDSLVSLGGNDGVTPVLKSNAASSNNPFRSDFSQDAQPASTNRWMTSSITTPSLIALNDPPQYSSKTPISPSLDPKKVKISSTARGKPASDLPLASAHSSHLRAPSKPDLRSVVGAPVNGSADPSGADLGALPKQEQSERGELVGKGPYWAVQRGWTKGVVTSKEEADRRTKNFPGPVIRYFEADQVDEAIAFVKAGALASRPRSRTGNGGSEDDLLGGTLPSSSSGSSGLGRSVSLMEKSSQSAYRPLQSRHRHNAKGGAQGQSLGGEAPSGSAVAFGAGAAPATNGSYSGSTTRAVPKRPSLAWNRVNSYTPELSPVMGTAIEPEGDFSFGHRLERSALSKLFAATAQGAQDDLQGSSAAGRRAPTAMSVLFVEDLRASITFYTETLGLIQVDRMGGEQALIALPTHQQSPTICLRARGSAPTSFGASASSSSLSGSTILLPFHLPSDSSSTPYSLLQAVKSRFESLIQGAGDSDLLSSTLAAGNAVSASSAGGPRQSANSKARVLSSGASADSIEHKAWGATELSLVDADGHLLIISVTSASNSSFSASPISTSPDRLELLSSTTTAQAAPSLDNSAPYRPTRPFLKTYSSTGTTGSSSASRGSNVGAAFDPSPLSSKPDFSQGRPQWTLIKDDDDDL
ncbi:hypothetical protein BCV69DRAFT_284400 [Microstroma glucosiphilum]|uniref:Uncharacterized protein n=1 Tax=Pseudomicrostroma glucosiphilum TaxID=1684307 RepID=A0A316U335_9BASI|nr:hypothetical protein BCV69DRAFT_284400 [Pseudomicrostroma glucosiphilum]PWN19248.1 hypothetical protein BCV69DRAFT_284400 [Pseudomicrostroma glucosiphilum]